MEENQQPEKSTKLKRWLKKVGLLGFLFFLAKGIVWLFIFYGAANLISC